MLTNLYFVRHAHSTYTSDEVGRPLSSEGQIDAIKISKILEKENIDIVISSPYKRAIQTVEGVATFIGKDIIVEEGFKERVLAGQPVVDFQSAIKKVWEEPSFSWDGGESNIIAQERGIQATLNMLEKYEGKNIVIGTHGNIMVLILSYFDDKYDYDFWSTLEMPAIYKFTFLNKNFISAIKI